MDRLDALIKKLLIFRQERDWKKFHKPKDLAMALSIESSELMEEFLWKSEPEVKKFVNESKQTIAYEMADVAVYLLLLANDLDIDLFSAINAKMKINAKKYPVNKCKGIATKYDKL